MNDISFFKYINEYKEYYLATLWLCLQVATSFSSLETVSPSAIVRRVPPV